ncbi:MAG: succinylglutamate desuccinylase/aspartoacylase family protein [Calditrichaeota bacterium]|nr:succinylglutamate desuccinylase/aspartoacylase family protein [Calditrichota bacterium]MCB0269838.1 succinylglutamate desuccinylase/aspartoacylase family protein [Calditrichota bacterium]
MAVSDQRSKAIKNNGKADAVLEISGKKINPGEQTEIHLKIARLPTHTVINLPVLVYRAIVPGPTLLLTAGLHGDEINGVETLRRLIKSGLIRPDAGTVVVIPVVNIHGFIQNSRRFPDGKDLNRSFPGQKDGSLAGRFAWVLMNDILPTVDFGIDFHTGGAHKANFPHLRCNLDDPEIASLAKAFAPPFIVHSKPPDHSFRKAAAIQGKSILTFEAGESLRFDELAITEGMNGIHRLMFAKGMRQLPGVPGSSKILHKSWWNRASYSGLFRAFVKPGDQIRRHQQIGSISDPFGEVEYPIKAREKGFVIGLNNLCVVNKGEALIHIGTMDSATKSDQPDSQNQKKG